MKAIKLIAIASAIGLVACTKANRQQNDAAHPTKISEMRVSGNKSRCGTDTGRVVSLTASDFRRLVMDYEAHPQEWVFEGRHPAVVDFYATWCRPCKMMSPIVEDMASAYVGKIDFYKIDIDKERELAAAFGIQSIPAFLFIPVKGEPGMQLGAMQREDFEKVIHETLLR